MIEGIDGYSGAIWHFSMAFDHLWFGEEKILTYKDLPLGGSIQDDALVSTVVVYVQATMPSKLMHTQENGFLIAVHCSDLYA